MAVTATEEAINFSEGSLGAACRPDNSCDEALVCLDNQCAEPPINPNDLATCQPAPINFEDSNLASEIRQKLRLAEGQSITTCDCLGLIQLIDSNNDNIPEAQKIRSLVGIEHCSNLKYLYIFTHAITSLAPLQNLHQLTYIYIGNGSLVDISPLGGLNQLKKLYLSENDIVDITPLQGLDQLQELSLINNHIVDISPLGGLLQLTKLYLNYKNRIVDISPLRGLNQLNVLFLTDNPIVDISPLQNLNQLNRLSLNQTAITDISPLVTHNVLDQGDRLDIRDNPGLIAPPDVLRRNQEQAGILQNRGVTVRHSLL